jgi:hypothetical protein
MTISPKIWDVPPFPVSGQLFYVPGAVVQGGLTSGGAQIISPEPGGFSVLEITPSLQVGEWLNPLSSWLMSKTNGQILRVRFARTPQVAWSNRRMNNILPEWSVEGSEVDALVSYVSASLEGSSTVVIDLSAVGKVLRAGHVIGHGNYAYKIDEIEYDGNIATATVTPPLRQNVAVDDIVYLRPWFIGRIGNASEILASYEAGNMGHIQPGKIVLNEAVI